jgi:hypothetical protein
MSSGFGPYYQPPGVYITQGILPNTVIIQNLPRGLCLVAPGSKTLYQYDVMVQRGLVSNEALTFTASGGYQHLATLQYTSDGIQIDSSLSYFDGTNYVPVASKFWGFSDSSHIWLASEAYSQAKSYYFSYQAINKASDLFPGTPDVRSIVRIGDRPGVATYTEGSDFLLTTSISAPTPASGNAGNGTITIGSSARYTASEPRVYTIQIATSGSVGSSTFNWFGNTPSAGSTFGVVTGVDLSLEDGIIVSFSGTFTAGDTYTFLAENEGGVTWGISQTFLESKGSSDVYQDYTGAITGTPYTYYMLLSHIPTGAITVTGSGAHPISVTQVGTTSYASFASYPTGEFPLSVSYPWKGKAPAYGKVYYVSYEYAKDASTYNQVGLVFNETDFYAAVGPAAPDNLLALAGQVAFQSSLPFLFFVQISDPDGDGLYTDADYLTGLQATEGKSEITDIVMTSMTDSLRSSLRDSIARMSSATEKKYRMGWFWMPMNTPSGDTSTPDTLVYESTISMQVTVDSPALGRFILLGNTWATRNYIMGDGTSQTLTTPAWALAAGIAALQNSFPSPSDTLLRQEIPGFIAIDTYGDSEMRYRAGNGLLMLEQLGSLIRVYDTTTTAFTSDDANEPSAMVQKDAVTKAVTKQLDAAIIGMVPQTTADAVSAIRTQLALVLNALVSDGTIASFEDDLGNPRALNPFQDIWVDRVSGSRTGFQFKYFYFLRYPIKRLYGTYYVDQNVLFSSGGVPTVTNS